MASRKVNKLVRFWKNSEGFISKRVVQEEIKRIESKYNRHRVKGKS